MTAPRGEIVRLAIAALLFATAGVAAADTPNPRGDVNTRGIATAPGTLNTASMTTLVNCTNFGTVPATIYSAFYDFDDTYVCTSGTTNVPVGHTISMSIAPVASMANVDDCGASAAPVTQGVVYIIGKVNQTLRIRCTAELIAVASNPPVALDRLTLYTDDGAPLRDVIFADGVDP